MSVPTIALSALALAYIEARTHISEDLRLIYTGFGRMLARRNLEKEHRVNFFYVFEEYAKTQPRKLAIKFPRQIKPIPKGYHGDLDDFFVVEEYTYKQTYTKALQYAAVLRETYGVGPESAVGMDLTNKPDFLFLWLAIWSLGALPAFINYNLTESALVHCVKVSNMSLFICDDDPAVVELVSPATPAIENAGASVIYLDTAFRSLADASAPYRAPDSDRHPEHLFKDPAILIYTSGTTGMPKPAVVSWKKCTLGSHMYSATTRFTKNDIIYSPMPLYHSAAAVLGLLNSWSLGTTYALGAKFSARTFWTQAKLTKATYAQYVGETCRYLLNAPPNVDDTRHQVRVVNGNGMRPDIWRRFKERFNIETVAEFWGATEGPGVLNNFQNGEYGVGALSRQGIIMNFAYWTFTQCLVKMDPENETEIYRDPKTGFALTTDVDEPGELLIKIADPNKIEETFQGYYGNEKATKEKVIFNVFKKGDAYFRSGDLLRKDADNLAYFVDRLGDTFRWKSENVSTNEVEECISQFNESKHINQVVVVGVKVPQHEGRAGFAVIAPHSLSSLPDPEDLAKYLTSNLPKYAVPVFIKFVESISTTGNNKIQKAVYRAQKFPNLEETIWWLHEGTYVPLQHSHWEMLNAGKIKL